jgi:hypothetical protein
MNSVKTSFGSVMRLRIVLYLFIHPPIHPSTLEMESSSEALVTVYQDTSRHTSEARKLKCAISNLAQTAMREEFGSKLGQDIYCSDYSFSRFSSVTPRICINNPTNYATSASFHSFSSSLFTNHPNTGCYAPWGTDIAGNWTALN